MRLIEKLNAADRCAKYWRQGTLAYVVLMDRLVDLGFYAIARRDESVVAYLDGVRFELDGDQP